MSANTVLIYGKTGTTKTSNAGRFAKWLFSRTGKPVRMITADLGGYQAIQPLEQAGIIIPWQISALDHPLSVLRRLSKGQWPSIVDGPGGKKQLRMFETSAEQWKGISGYIIEGMTSIGDVIMRHLRLTGQKLGESPNYSMMDKGDDGTTETFYGSNMSYYGFIQDFLYELTHNFAQLPVEKILWTALEARGEDEVSKETIIGPAIAGKKAVSKVPSWMGTCLHFESYEEKKGDMLKYRGWFVQHRDPVFNAPMPAKPRVPPQRMPELLKKWPQGWFPLTFDQGLDTFMDEEERILSETGGEEIKWKEGILRDRKETT